VHENLLPIGDMDDVGGIGLAGQLGDERLVRGDEVGARATARNDMDENVDRNPGPRYFQASFFRSRCVTWMLLAKAAGYCHCYQEC
jgi:hypothetical protein